MSAVVRLSGLESKQYILIVVCPDVGLFAQVSSGCETCTH